MESPNPRTAAINIVIVKKKVPMNSEAIFAFDVGVVIDRLREIVNLTIDV
tara:strand:- start:298 stop:447 length:150 start_codon:yes stop_codon:yes gene_type:complete